jgi:hypothetical protein
MLVTHYPRLNLTRPRIIFNDLSIGVRSFENHFSEHAYTLHIFELFARNSNTEDIRDKSRILLAYIDITSLY